MSRLVMWLLFAVASASRVRTAAHTRFGQHLSERAQQLARISVHKPEKGSMVEIVSSLNEIYQGVEARQSTARDLHRERAKGCNKADAELARSVEKSEGMVSDQAADLESINAEVADLETSIEDIKKQMSEASESIKTSTDELKNLRGQEKASEAAGLMAMRQVDGTISAMHLRGGAGVAESHKPAPLNDEVSKLQELSSRLTSFGAPALSLVQTAEHHPDQSMLLLRADKRQLLNASSRTMSAFNEQEKDLLELIRIKEKELVTLGHKLKDVQPTLADKLRQASEITRSKAAAERGLNRDKELKEAAGKRCSLVKTGFEEQDKLRTQLASPVKIAAKLLETRDAASFITRDLQGLKKIALIQIDIDGAQDDDLGAAMKVKDNAGLLLEENADASVVATASSSDASSSNDASSGPFDKVNDMIQSLITSLQDQANEDQTKNQFCLEGAAAQQKEKLATKNAIDEEKTKASWATSSIAELDDTVAFCKEEVARLEEVTADAKAEQDAEKKSAEEEKEELGIAKNVMEKVGEVLDGVCELSTPQLLQHGAVALLQGSHDSKWTQCEEAAQNLREAVGKCDELTEGLNSYTAGFGELTAGIEEQATKATTERGNDLATAKADRAKRNNDLETAKADLDEKKKDLGLVEEAEKELEDNCGPGKDPHQARMDRREEEMGALKEAYQVLDGEAVPVSS